VVGSRGLEGATVGVQYQERADAQPMKDVKCTTERTLETISASRCNNLVSTRDAIDRAVDVDVDPDV
jgi:hypothetical protein